MKFDLDTAWKDTTALLRDNFGLLAVVAGVFYFVPYAAALLWIPGLAEIAAGGFDPNAPETEAMIDAMLADYWWAIVLLGLVQGTGFLAMLALLRRRASPTVGEAIAAGARSILTYIAASILLGLAIGLALIVLVGVPSAAGSAPLMIIGTIAAMVAAAYLATKFSMSSPVIANEDERNPFKALRRSWQLTKGNSLRLFSFFVLLVIAYIVVSIIISLVFSLIFALGGADVQSFGQAISSSLMNAAVAVLFACVLAAVHTQLTRLGAPRADTRAETGPNTNGEY